MRAAVPGTCPEGRQELLEFLTFHIPLTAAAPPEMMGCAQSLLQIADKL